MLRHISGAMSKYANVVSEPHGMGLRFCIVLGDGDYTEFVLHESECRELQKLLKEAIVDELPVDGRIE
jgi:hypothetical protein